VLLYPLAKTYNRPQGAAKRTTAANAATEEPLYIHWESFLKNAVYAHHCRFVLLWSNTRHQTIWKFGIKSIAETKSAKKEEILGTTLLNTWYVFDNAVMGEADVYGNLIFKRNGQYVFQRLSNL
jgi:hypothetical protein